MTPRASVAKTWTSEAPYPPIMPAVAQVGPEERPESFCPSGKAHRWILEAQPSTWGRCRQCHEVRNFPFVDLPATWMPGDKLTVIQ